RLDLDRIGAGQPAQQRRWEARRHLRKATPCAAQDDAATGVRTELYRDQFAVLLEDLRHRLLKLKWLEGSSGMTSSTCGSSSSRRAPDPRSLPQNVDLAGMNPDM